VQIGRPRDRQIETRIRREDRVKKLSGNKSEQSRAKQSTAQHSTAMSSTQQHEVLDLTRCNGCGKNAKKGVTFNVCSGCKFAAYCSSKCQGAGWASHKPICKLKKKELQAREKEAAIERGGGGSGSGSGSGSSSGSGSGLGDMGSIMAVLTSPPSPPPQYGIESAYNASLDGHHKELQMALQQRRPRLDVDLAEPEFGSTPTYVAAQEGHVRCLSILASHNADLSKANRHGWAPIHIACERGRLTCIEVLLDNGVNIDVCVADERGDTPLIIACQSGHAKCMALLIDRGASQSKANSNGTTAAHQACQVGHLKCLQLLSKRGADLNMKTRNGESPLDWARRFKQLECIDFLLEKNAVAMRVGDLRIVSEVSKVCIAVTF
jgi:ankyrin repeat protein